MTIKDLARLSGYSLGTVSRVLNNQPNVSDKARAAILAIAEESGFELNESAQLLKQQRSNAVLIIVKGTANEMFASMVEQLQSLFSRTTHPLIVDFIDEDENEIEFDIMDIIEHNGENYYVLLPVDDDSDELEYVILRETGEGEEKTLVGIDDEKTLDDVFKKYQKHSTDEN